MADIVVTAANVKPGTDAVTLDAVAGATITAGQAVYRDSVTRKVSPADANSVTPDVRTPIGVALNGASLDQPVKIQCGGGINPGGTVVVGTIYVLSANPGGICPAADLASGHFPSVIGIGTTASNIKMAAQGAANGGPLVGGVAVP